MKTRQRVQIANTNSCIDNLTGSLLGKSINGLVHIWVVGLDGSYTDKDGEEYLAVTLPESCLKIIDGTLKKVTYG